MSIAEQITCILYDPMSSVEGKSNAPTFSRVPVYIYYGQSLPTGKP